MFGAIAGDVIGSVYERHHIKTTEFQLFQKYSRFTDDTVLTVATAYAILHKVDYALAYRQFGRQYPDAGYGGAFFSWIFKDDSKPYNSWGNGAAMRVSPVGFAFDTIGQVLDEAKCTAKVSHNHPEGIRGAQAVALAVFLARKQVSKITIKKEIVHRFQYDLNRTVESIRPYYRFDVSCQGSVPEAIISFLDADNFETAVRNAISLGGDSDTLACIAGGIAHAFYKKIPDNIVRDVRERLPETFLEIIDSFETIYLP
ncbi:MAG: ADP-ribosylglycohydrolase family protein [Desulfobacterales bacterium]